MSSGDGSEAVSQDSPASPPPEGEMAKPPERIGGDDDNKGDSTGTGSNELDSVVTDPSTLIVYANAPAESSATMPHQLLLPAVQQVPAAVQVKKGVRKHTWEDEMDILVLQGKRRARLEAGVRDNNLRAWAMATGCAAAVAMKERRDLASHLFALVGLVGDDSGHFLMLEKLADLLLVLRLPDVLAKVRDTDTYDYWDMD